jgi:hypothetical protein
MFRIDWIMVDVTPNGERSRQLRSRDRAGERFTPFPVDPW